MERGFFITFEGLDGSGKTTQVQRLGGWLKAEGHRVTALRQPGSTVLGDRVRGILLDSRSEAELGEIAPLTELALMFADRAQAIAEVIRPALQRGEIVLCDRYTDSSEAYQGGGRGLGSDRVRALHEAVCEGLQPGLTVMLLPDLATSLERARQRNERDARQAVPDENRFEREGKAFYGRIQAAYEAIAAREPRRVAVIRSDGTLDEVEAEIRTVVAARLAAR